MTWFQTVSRYMIGTDQFGALPSASGPDRRVLLAGGPQVQMVLQQLPQQLTAPGVDQFLQPIMRQCRRCRSLELT
jgi:hypothetical protein